MDKKKVIYIGLLLIMTVMVSVTYFSYAFFTHKDEQHGKLNIVTGTLDYKVSSSLLDNTNSITLASNEKAKLNIKIESLNDINSKYELYYTTTNNNIEMGYTSANDTSTGTINANAKKTITVVIKNKTNSSAKVTFGVQGGFTTNTLVLAAGLSSLTPYQDSYCEVASNTVYNFDYTGNIQDFNVPCNGTYKLETWGAQGGEYDSTYYGGYGAYSTGIMNLAQNTNLFITVGGAGRIITASSVDVAYAGGYNGGGNITETWVHGSSSGTIQSYGTGGGATSISYENKLLKETTKSQLLMVAGGGGGAAVCVYSNAVRYKSSGGSAGGITGTMSKNITGEYSNLVGTCVGPNQSDQGYVTFNGSAASNGSYGQAGGVVVGAGGGYYGGSTRAGVSFGGSSYISSTGFTDKAMYCYQCDEDLTNSSIFTVSTTGDSSYRDTTNCSNGYGPNPIAKCAKSNNGYARITYLNESTAEEKTAIKYLVTFNTNGGLLDKNYNLISIGDNIGTLPTPTKDSYIFDGWYLEDTFVTKVDSTYVPTSDITLYARYGTEINMNLGGRTRGYPSNTNSSDSTKRSYNMNTYIVGLAFDNYYSPSSVTNYSLTSNSYYVVQSYGYGIGIPMQLVPGNYILTCNLVSNSPNNTIFSVVKYTSDGTPSYYKESVSSASSTVKFDFTIDNSTSYEALVITGNGSNTSITASNIKLYKLD